MLSILTQNNDKTLIMLHILHNRVNLRSTLFFEIELYMVESMTKHYYTIYGFRFGIQYPLFRSFQKDTKGEKEIMEDQLFSTMNFS